MKIIHHNYKEGIPYKKLGHTTVKDRIFLLKSPYVGWGKDNYLILSTRGFCQKVELLDMGIIKKNSENLFSYGDLISLFNRDFSQVNKYWNLLQNPEFHNIYLKGNHILTLNRDKESLLARFQMGISFSLHTIKKERKEELKKIYWQYEYIRKLFGVLPATEEEIIEYRGCPPIRVILKTSPLGNKYVVKRKLPNNFGNLVYGECMRYNSPELLIIVVNYYMGDGDYNSHLFGSPYAPASCDSLLGEARREYFTHDLGEIILYREQAIFLAESLISEEEEEEDEEEENLELPIYEKWVRKMAKELKRNAHILPGDPHQPSIFPNRPPKSSPQENLVFVKKTAKLIFWVIALSPLAPTLFYSVVDFLLILAAAKYNFLYYFMHYGIILFSLKIIYKLSQMKNRSEGVTFLREIYDNFKENKGKFLITFIISFFTPVSYKRILNFTQGVLSTGGLLQNNGLEIGEKAYKEFLKGKLITTMRGVLTYRGIISNKDLQKEINPNIKYHREKIIGANLHHDRKKTPFFFSRLWNDGIIASQNDYDFHAVNNKGFLLRKFRRNQVIAFLSQIEDPALRAWLKIFIMGDKDQRGNPSMECLSAIYFGEESYGGEFYPNSIYRPSTGGMGDFVIENPKFGRVHYDIKNNCIFFSPKTQLSLDSMDITIEKLKGKNCRLLIDGTHQSIENVQNLRNILSQNPKYKDIHIVHPSESLFERGLSNYLHTPENLQNIEILEDKARYLVDHAINSGEEIAKLAISRESPNQISSPESEKEGFQKGNEIADNKLGKIKGEDPKYPWNIDDMSSDLD